MTSGQVRIILWTSDVAKHAPAARPKFVCRRPLMKHIGWYFNLKPFIDSYEQTNEDS